MIKRMFASKSIIAITSLKIVNRPRIIRKQKTFQIQIRIKI